MTVESSNNVKDIMKDYKKTKAMLPSPVPHASIFICYDENEPRYCRAFISGPQDTPYYAGVFIFDIFFPKEYPHVPPLLQFLNTAGGTERFHVNLYSDGKVCLSLLGNTDGSGVERWIPNISCLGQVLLSIQSLVLGDYNLGGKIPTPGPLQLHGLYITGDEYFDYRIATLRYTIYSLLQACTAGGNAGEYGLYCNDVVTFLHAHFKANRHQLLQQMKTDLVCLHNDTTRRNKLNKICLLIISKLMEL